MSRTPAVDADGIRAELDALEPRWSETARVVRGADGSITGAVIVEIDTELGRAWIYGPWVVDDEDWEEQAPALLDAALEQCVGLEAECLPELANTRLMALAEDRGWRRGSHIHHALVVDAATVAGWPERDSTGIRPSVAADLEDIRRVHDVEFPDTHTSADRLLASLTVLVATRAARCADTRRGASNPTARATSTTSVWIPNIGSAVSDATSSSRSPAS